MSQKKSTKLGFMPICNRKEHTTCYNYDNSNRPVIEIRQFNNVEKWEEEFSNNILLFLLEGVIFFTEKDNSSFQLKEKEFILLAASTELVCEVKEPTLAIVIRLEDPIRFCEGFFLKQLNIEKIDINDYLESENYTDILPIKQPLLDYLNAMCTFTTDGAKCRYFLHIKTQELFYILRYYYSKPELKVLFNKILDKQDSFIEEVLKNYSLFKTVNDLANFMNYTVSGFNKKFKGTFGVPPYQWMKQQKLKRLYKELCSGNKNFKELSFEYGFSSATHFNDFCKRNFGKTPGNIRNFHLIGKNLE